MLCTPRRIYTMFIEKLNEVRGDLVVNMKVNEAFLTYMVQKSVITDSNKSAILNVCVASVLTFFCCFHVAFSGFSLIISNKI